MIYIRIQNTDMMIFYKFGGIADPGKYLNILLKDQSCNIAKILEFTFFDVSFDPIYILINVDSYSYWTHSYDDIL